MKVWISIVAISFMQLKLLYATDENWIEKRGYEKREKFPYEDQFVNERYEELQKRGSEYAKRADHIQKRVKDNARSADHIITADEKGIEKRSRFPYDRSIQLGFENMESEKMKRNDQKVARAGSQGRSEEERICKRRCKKSIDYRQCKREHC